jgi:hypothetical protein
MDGLCWRRYRAPKSRAFLACGALVLVRLVATGVAAEPIDISDIEGACGSANPYFATAGELGATRALDSPAGEAVVVFRDAPGDGPSGQMMVATQADVGSTYGLAYDVDRRHLYAAAYHKRMVPFGPGGPGAIYRIDLESGAVEDWASLEAGPDRHAFKYRDDEPAEIWTGRTSLADIDLDDDAQSLFVANLYDHRIYRLSVPDGDIVGSFSHGAFGTPWSRSARLFALHYQDGWLYHAVTDVTGASRGTGSGWPIGYVYRSRSDGSEMQEVASFEIAWEIESGQGRSGVVG